MSLSEHNDRYVITGAAGVYGAVAADTAPSGARMPSRACVAAMVRVGRIDLWQSADEGDRVYLVRAFDSQGRFLDEFSATFAAKRTA